MGPTLLGVGSTEQVVLCAVAATLLAACSEQPKREAWAVVVSIAPSPNPKMRPDDLSITARTSDGASGEKSVLASRLSCRVGDTVHGTAQGIAFKLDDRACER